MRYLALLFLLSGCAPSNEAIGRTEWVTPATDATHGVVGPSGHVLLAGGGTPLTLLDPDGEVAWSVDCPSFCAGGAIDADGNSYLATSEERVELIKLAAEDGSIEWSLAFESGSAAGVVLGTDGAVWLHFNGSEPIDLGGGPVGGNDLGGRWGRFASDGMHLTSGALDFHVDTASGRALPDGGLMVRDDDRFELVAIDETGAEMWRVARDVGDFVAHDDGELTLVERVQVATGGERVRLVRLRSDHQERWRRDVAGDVLVTPLPDGAVLANGGDGLADPNEVEYLELIDADGDSRREVFTHFMVLFTGPPFDGYRFVLFDGPPSIVGRSIP